jgi:hypothetical protein
MSETAEDLEAKLLAILNAPDERAEVVDAIEKSADGEELSEDQRATLASLMDVGMPTPEEIIRDAKIAQHNAQIAARRKADLAKRKSRQAKPKKHRRR